MNRLSNNCLRLSITFIFFCETANALKCLVGNQLVIPAKKLKSSPHKMQENFCPNDEKTYNCQRVDMVGITLSGSSGKKYDEKLSEFSSG